MGIYDREYYRGGGSNPFLDSLARTGRVCKWLILINAGVFLLQAMSANGPRDLGPFTEAFQLNTQQVYQGQIWRVLTYAFLHSPFDIWHIIFNMLFLWWFGSELESMYGHKEFLTFYLIAAVAGGLSFVLFPGYQAWAYGVPVELAPRCVGASGAVTAIMLLYACHFPTRVIYLFFFLPVPIWLFVAFQVFQDTLGLIGGARGGVAVSAHLGGALFGFLYYRFGWRLSPLFTNFRWKFRARSRPRLKVYHGERERREPVAAVSAPKPTMDEQLEARVDAILEKIKTSGKDSLTEEERTMLQQASEMYKQRRSTRE